MTRSRQTNNDQGSDSSEEDSDERSPIRGRSGKNDVVTAAQVAQVDAQVDAMMAENSKASGA